MIPPDFTFARRDYMIALAIVLLAFAFRLVIILDRAHAPNEISAFDPPPGVDQQTYYHNIEAFRAGTFPPPRFHFQPGMSYFMIAASKLVRTDSLGTLRVLVAALASLNCALFMAMVRLAFGRRSISTLAGFLLAIYPVGAFYDTDFVITSQAAELLTIALFGILWLWHRPRHWIGAVLYGASFGALAITRFETVALAPVFGLWLIWARHSRLAVFQVALAALIAASVVLPVVLHNRAGGADYLITPVGAVETYRGNNRDADGTYGTRQAMASTAAEYTRFLWADIRLSPLRFVELVLHKIGLYLSSREPGNNLNYVISGESVSPLLRAVPLDFRSLFALSLFGLILLVRQREPVTALLGLSFVAFMAAILTIWVEARLRTPAIVFMIPAAAYGLVFAGEHFPLRLAGSPLRRLTFSSRDLRALLIPLPVVAAVLLVAHGAEDHLPRKLTADHLPPSATAANAVYDGTLKLVGWQVQEQYSRAGIIEPFHPYVVALYWQLLKPTTTNYSFSLGYYLDGERIMGTDHPIGTVSYPEVPTSRWKTGRLYVEYVGLAYKSFEGSIGTSGDLLLVVYPDRNAERLLPAEGVPSAPTHLQIARPALIWGSGALPDDLPSGTPETPFGNSLVLKSWSYPASVPAGQPFDMTLGWQTTSVPIRRSYTISVQLLDAAGESAAQLDSPPHNGQLLTSSLPENFLFGDTRQIVAPPEAGRYTVHVIVYDSETLQRLAVPGAPDNVLQVGELTVTGNAPQSDSFLPPHSLRVLGGAEGQSEDFVLLDWIQSR